MPTYVRKTLPLAVLLSGAFYLVAAVAPVAGLTVQAGTGGVEATETECITRGERVSLVRGILNRFGATVGDNDYRAKYDLNGDGVIDQADIDVLVLIPPCGQR